MLKKELEEQNDRLVTENEELRKWLEKYDYLLSLLKERVTHLEERETFLSRANNGVQDWITEARHFLANESRRLDSIGEHCEKLQDLADAVNPFQSAVENWLGAVKETLDFQSSRIGFVEERADRLEQSSERLELYYRGLTQTTRRFARHFKVFQRKIEGLTGQVGSLMERMSEIDRPKGFRAFWVRWRDLH